MRILAIETSCDETSVALVDCKGTLKNPKFKVLKNLVSSQIKVHRPFGGVVPTLAKREHQKNLPKIIGKIVNRKLKIDVIAITVGPGLEPALWAGIEFAKDLAKKLKKPLIGANHMEGHLYSNWLENPSVKFPAVALVVSGGHTILLKMDSLTKWKKLGETRDDAAGEAFDKVARLLGLPYPGGPEIQKLASKGNPAAVKFPRPMLTDKNFDFSFSGLKTSVLYYLRANPLVASNHTQAADIAASFQQAIVDVLAGKTVRAARRSGAKSVLLCGGVSANKPLREGLGSHIRNLGMKFFVPDFEYNTDNAAMIAAAAYIQKLRGKKLKITAQSNLNL
ncbi:MAG: tRNA (adenosine(37)-N6)-threonylcarbamoyltransferase complex transferase subunit TsaD [Candidatus Harrisonbacteria bacterium]|nr:tRNA (adenosine(37)-N6)-threonylcarbamoyltransferase complex transferase subunit TsaD [Candidatus Harrisonbacteria bacterium]